MNQNLRRYDVLREIRNDPRASFQELAERCGLKTKSAVSYHIDRLIEEGLISKERYLSRSLEVVSNPAPYPHRPSATSPKSKNDLGEDKQKIDQRKRQSAKTCEKKQRAGQQGRGTSATIARQKTERKLKESERIEMVVAMAALDREIGNGKDVIKDYRGYTSMHCTKVG